MNAAEAIEQLRSDLLALGVRAGGALLVHSSLRSLGEVTGGAETVIAGLEAALGASGTLLMPALTYERVTPENPVFDLLGTPGNVGRIPETFRCQAGTLRSLHPTHSICARGRLADEFIREHGLDSTPCGAHSPLRKLPDYRGQILMLGCGLEPNTSMHAIEELVEPPYLYDPPLAYTLILSGGFQVVRRYRPHNFWGWEQRYDRVGSVLGRGLRLGRVLKAECHLIEAAVLWTSALEKLREDELFFVERIA